MKTQIATALALSAGLAAILAGCGAEPQAGASPAGESSVKAGSLVWLTDYRSALDTASKDGKPILIDFYTDWCGFCKQMDRETFTDSEVVETAGKMVLLKVNAEKAPALASRFGVKGYPHFVFLSPRGMTLRSVEGFQGPRPFVAEMKGALEDARSKG